MNDSADIKLASQKLDDALSKFENAINPLLQKVSDLSVKTEQSESFMSDRAKLATDLDNARADKEAAEAQMKQRETELDSLAAETTQEIDLVMRHVKAALEGLKS